jgi:hypothetical protein
LIICARGLPTIPDGAFDEYRRSRAWHAWKEAMWNAHCLLPTQAAKGGSKCFCRAGIDLRSTVDHIYATHMDSQFRG